MTESKHQAAISALWRAKHALNIVVIQSVDLKQKSLGHQYLNATEAALKDSVGWTIEVTDTKPFWQAEAALQVALGENDWLGVLRHTHALLMSLPELPGETVYKPVELPPPP